MFLVCGLSLLLLFVLVCGFCAYMVSFVLSVDNVIVCVLLLVVCCFVYCVSVRFRVLVVSLAHVLVNLCVCMYLVFFVLCCIVCGCVSFCHTTVRVPEFGVSLCLSLTLFV